MRSKHKASASQGGGGGSHSNRLILPQIQLFESATEAKEIIISETPESAFTFSGTSLSASTTSLATWVNTITEDADGLKRIRIVIPAKTTVIGKEAFYTLFSDKTTFDNIRIVGIDFSKATALTSIGSNAFSYIGHTSSNAFTNSDLMSELTEPLILPDTITSIGLDDTNGAFKYFKSKGELKLPSNEKYTIINKCTFNNSQFLGTITIPKNVKKIDKQAFEIFGNKDSEVFLTFEENSKLETIEGYSFNGAKFKGNLTLPNSLTSLGSSSGSAFQASTFNGTLTLPTNSSFTNIPMQTFDKVPFTRELVIPENVITIGKSAFRETLFEKLTFSGTPQITTLGSSAFSVTELMKELCKQHLTPNYNIRIKCIFGM